MTKKRAVFLYSSRWEEGGYPDSSPFKTYRPGLVRETVLKMGLLQGDGRSEVEPQSAPRSDLERFHYPEYLDAIKKAEEGSLGIAGFAMGLGIPDCPIFSGMYDYAALTVGGTTTGARLILDGECDLAFNPSGGYHHAHAGRAAGFCYINDVAIAGMILAEAGKRIFFVDLDVHHSDGVQSAFYNRNDVMVVSLHESGRSLYPGTGFEDEIGVNEGKGYTVNLPLPMGTYDGAYLKVFNEVVIPLLEAYQPDVLMTELGMDTLAGDPLAHLNLTNNVHVDILEKLLSYDKPLLATGGGGYNVDNTVRSWALAWSVICGEETQELTSGMGGVMLESTEWLGGLRDRTVISDVAQRSSIDAEIDALIGKIHSSVFPLHGLV